MSVTSQSEINQHEYMYPQVEAIGTDLAWRTPEYAPVLLVTAGKSALSHEVVLNDGRSYTPLPETESQIKPHIRLRHAE